MTGYASRSFLLADDDGKTAELVITVKTVNNRYFETNYKLLPALQPYEFDITKQLKKNLVRGSIQFSIVTNDPDFFQGEIKPALQAAKEYAKSLQLIRDTVGISSEIKLDHFVRLPHLFVSTERGLTDAQTKILFGEIEKTIKEVTATRKSEGLQLQEDIVKRFSLIARELEKIRPLFVARIDEQKKKVEGTLQEIKGDESMLATSQKTALYTMLDKLDLQEEITRLSGHLQAADSIIHSDTLEKGKRLDFTLQEMVREANTILSKCNDLAISGYAITIKVELEKIREQIQNIL
jgi:uncharacterized protein (TIGR00255 family)